MERRRLFLVPLDPAEPDAQRDEIGAHRIRRLRPHPPRRAVFTAMAFGISRRKGRLPDAPQPMHRRDRDPSLAALECRVDRLQRVLAAEEMLRDGDRDIADRDAVLARKRDFFGRSGRAKKLRCVVAPPPP